MADAQPSKDPKDEFLYPASEKNGEGTLKLDGIHTMHYEEFGNPQGIPIVYLHGGPGAGHGDHFHRYFDPKVFRVIIYDQRGAGLSTPAAETRDNTPDLLVEDLHKLKNHLGIDKWHVYGGSWGSTLALLYGEEHPESTLSLTLRGIFLMRKMDIEMFYDAAELFRPEEAKRIAEFLPENERSDFFENFYKRLMSDDPAISFPAAQAWARFENVCCYLQQPPDGDPRIVESNQDALNVARIEAHYFRNCLFDPDDRILKNIDRIRHIPTIMVQGLYDIVCPPQIAYDLKQAFPEAHLQLTVSGHAAIEPEIMKALVAATNRIRETGSPLPKAEAPGPAAAFKAQQPKP
ncbi:MAG: prolyl aminopeptidase [Alphaproteobacteria bacterium]|nr:MAG: prolyl aminopeptidase [Alphaproteobacteria bacterium]